MKKFLFFLLMEILLFDCSKDKPMKVNYLKNLDKTRKIATTQSLQILNNKVQMFYIDKSRYPQSIEELKPYLGNISLKAPNGKKYYYDTQEHKFKIK